MADRQRLSNRRASEQFAFTCNDLKYVASVSFFPDGRLAEIFIGNSKAGSHSDSAAKDSAVVCSIALQFGVPLDVIRRALLRDARGVASSPLGTALDVLAGKDGSPRAAIPVLAPQIDTRSASSNCSRFAPPNMPTASLPARSVSLMLSTVATAPRAGQASLTRPVTTPCNSFSLPPSLVRGGRHDRAAFVSGPGEGRRAARR
jgi:hypothetical protein